MVAHKQRNSKNGWIISRIPICTGWHISVMASIQERFYQFGRCGRSYILNMDHIVSVERGEIVMDNGATIYVPRNKAAEFKKSYFSYYFDRRDDTGGVKAQSV